MFGIRKEFALEVFDFNENKHAYAKKKKKNEFGYKYSVRYYRGDKLIYETPLFDNVDDKAVYWLAFRMNYNQLKSLRKKISGLLVKEKEISEKDVTISFSDGSTLTYHGNNVNDLCQKVLTKKMR